jgi:hypothetical protein
LTIALLVLTAWLMVLADRSPAVDPPGEAQANKELEAIA